MTVLKIIKDIVQIRNIKCLSNTIFISLQYVFSQMSKGEGGRGGGGCMLFLRVCVFLLFHFWERGYCWEINNKGRKNNNGLNN